MRKIFVLSSRIHGAQFRVVILSGATTRMLAPTILVVRRYPSNQVSHLHTERPFAARFKTTAPGVVAGVIIQFLLQSIHARYKGGFQDGWKKS